MNICIINGPNLNLLGLREKNIYGEISFDTYFKELKSVFSNITFSFFQSNIEGELINKIHELGFKYDGIILNAGGYTHTSVSLSDAIASVKTPVIEVHISNIYSREEFRKESLLAKNCIGSISGFGLSSYKLAIQAFLNLNK
ncbi:MAG: type II 3-dehydroquinate dehydratase [Flavobacteriales bacterium]|nr:type II 3-dehydroquinate dehydratase [Flavobacteriales bacterium]|tara:strand:- start:831 stop:1256 length:426 start_codon:yes stop_codon:yes gene_type:complete